MRRFGTLLAVIGLLAGALGVAPAQPAAAQNGLEVTDLADAALTPADLAEALAGVGVTVVEDSVTFIGNERAGGLFSGGAGIVGIESGIILSSGQVVDVVGPNQSPGTSTAFGTPGDDDLGELAGVDTFDAAILEFEFEVGEGADQVFFNYVFGSEEYNEFVGSGFNDVFAFWVNGENCALVNGNPVSINTINNGQPNVDPTNPHLYINNDPFNPDSTGTVAPDDLLDTEMDGLTVVLNCEASVDSGTNTMRMGIADGSDEAFDSWVLIQAGSLTTTPPDPEEPPAADLAITKSADPDPATVDESLTYTLDVDNLGPDTATDVIVEDELPASVLFDSAGSTQGSCEEFEGTVTCTLGTLELSATAQITIVVTPTEEGVITNQATVTANETDPNLDNNTVSIETNVFTTVCKAEEDCEATASNDEATVSIECPADECEFITLTVDEVADDVCGDALCEVSGFIDIRAAEGADKDGTFLLMALDIDGVLGSPGRVQFFYDGDLISTCRPRGHFNNPDLAARITTPCLFRSTSPDEDDSNQVEVLFRLRNFDEDPPWGVR